MDIDDILNEEDGGGYPDVGDVNVDDLLLDDDTGLTDPLVGSAAGGPAVAAVEPMQAQGAATVAADFHSSDRASSAALPVPMPAAAPLPPPVPAPAASRRSSLVAPPSTEDAGAAAAAASSHSTSALDLSIASTVSVSDASLLADLMGSDFAARAFRGLEANAASGGAALLPAHAALDVLTHHDDGDGDDGSAEGAEHAAGGLTVPVPLPDGTTAHVHADQYLDALVAHHGVAPTLTAAAAPAAASARGGSVRLPAPLAQDLLDVLSDVPAASVVAPSASVSASGELDLEAILADFTSSTLGASRVGGSNSSATSAPTHAQQQQPAAAAMPLDAGLAEVGVALGTLPGISFTAPAPAAAPAPQVLATAAASSKSASAAAALAEADTTEALLRSLPAVASSRRASVELGVGATTTDLDAEADAEGALCSPDAGLAILSGKARSPAPPAVALARRSLACLAAAGAAEAALLQGGPRRVVSPLAQRRHASQAAAARRRAAAAAAGVDGGDASAAPPSPLLWNGRTLLPPAAPPQAPFLADVAPVLGSGIPSLTTIGGNGLGVPFGSSVVGIAHVDTLAGITERLKANAVGAAGAGSPTCIAACASFIAVGCSRSSVLLFDHNQELRGVLGRPAGGSSSAGSAGAQVDGAVTALDISPSGEQLIAGFYSGRVALWDVSSLAKASLIKAVEPHKEPVVSVRFISPSAPSILTVDVTGNVSNVVFSKFLGVKWNAEVRGILDGARCGQIVAVSVLHPPAEGNGGSASGGAAGKTGGAGQPGSGAAPGASGSTGSGSSTLAASLFSGVLSASSSSLMASFTAAASALSPAALMAASDPRTLATAQPYGTLVAISTRESTFVLVTSPMLSIVHKWLRPADVPAHVIPSLAWARARVAGTAAAAAAADAAAAAAMLAAASSSATSGGPPPASGAGLATSSAPADAALAAAASAARHRNGSTMPGHGVVTSFAVPTLARAWGNHVSLLQVQPTGGFAVEITNLGTIGGSRSGAAGGPGGVGAGAVPPAAGARSAAASGGLTASLTAVPASAAALARGAAAASAAAAATAVSAASAAARQLPALQGSLSNASSRVFGSLTSTLLGEKSSSSSSSSGGGMPLGGPGGQQPQPQPSGPPMPGPAAPPPPSSNGAPSTSGSGAFYRPCEFVLADDADSLDPVIALTWLDESRLLYITAEDALCVLDTTTMEDADALDLGGLKLLHSAVLQVGGSAAGGVVAAPLGAGSAGGAQLARHAGGASIPAHALVDRADVPVAVPGAPGGSGAAAAAATFRAAAGTSSGGSGLAALRGDLAARSAAVRQKLTTTVQNSLAVVNGRLFALAHDRLLLGRLRSWPDRVNAHIADGAWLSALALALDTYAARTAEFYEAVDADERRTRWAALRAATLANIAASSGAGAISLGDGSSGSAAASAAASSAGAAMAASLYDPSVFARRRASEAPFAPGSPAGDVLERLLRDYIRVMAAHPPDTFAPSSGAFAGPSAASTAANSHWTIVAGVCIDYCVSTGRPHLLFTEIFDRFVAAGQQAVLLQQLEPYILTERVTSLPPIALKAFVDHFRTARLLHVVERCLLHLDIGSLDLDATVRTCLRHRLYSSLVFVVNHGLMDCAMPIDLLAAALMQPGGDEGAAGGALAPVERARLSYRLFLYIAYCLLGRTFPHGKLAAPHELPAATGAVSAVRGIPAGGGGASSNTPPSLLTAGDIPSPLRMLLALPPLLGEDAAPEVRAVLAAAAVAHEHALSFDAAGSSSSGALALEDLPAASSAAGAAGRGRRGSFGFGSSSSNNGPSSGGPNGAASRRGYRLSFIKTKASGALGSLFSTGGANAGANASMRAVPFLRGGEGGGVIGPRERLVTASGAVTDLPPVSAGATGGSSTHVLPESSASVTRVLAQYGVLPRGMTPAGVRKEVLAHLVEQSPQKFPAVSPTLLDAGGLLPGARACESFPGPSPRLQVLAKLDIVALLSCVGRLATAAADAIRACVVYTEGEEGLLVRRRCLPGMRLPLPSPPPHLALPPAALEAGAAPPGALQKLLDALVEAVVTAFPPSDMRVARSGGGDARVAGASQPPARGASGWASLRAGLHSESLRALSGDGGAAAPVPPAAALPVPVAATLAFVLFQACRLGPGFAPLIKGLTDAAGASSGVAAALAQALVCLSVPLPAGVSGWGGASSGSLSLLASPSSAALTLGDTDALLTDELLDALVGSWSLDSDEALLGALAARAGADDAPVGEGVGAAPSPGGPGSLPRRVVTFTTVADAVKPARGDATPFSALRAAAGSAAAADAAASSPAAVAFAGRWSREALLVRFVRSVELPPPLRASLLDAARLYGLHHLSLVLLALAGDVVGVVDAFLRAAPASPGAAPPPLAQLPASYDSWVLGSRVFRFVRAVWGLACAARARHGQVMAAVGGALGEEELAALAEASSASSSAAVSAGGACPHVASAVMLEDDPDFEATLAQMVKVALTSAAAGTAPDASPEALSRSTTGAVLRAAEAMRLHLMTPKVLTRLVAVDQRGTAELIVDLYPQDSEDVIAALEKHPDLQLVYLQHFLQRAGVLGVEPDDGSEGGGSGEDGSGASSASRGFSSSSSGSVTVAPAIHLQYITLLCRFRPPSAVYRYLTSTTEYPLDAALKIVRDTFHIQEATAYLLERTGDTARALELLLSTLDDRMDALYAGLRLAAATQTAATAAAGGGTSPTAAASSSALVPLGAKDATSATLPSSSSSSSAGGIDRCPTALHLAVKRDANAFADTLLSVTALCARSHLRFRDDTITQRQWFATLDRIVAAQRAVRADRALASGGGSATASNSAGGKAGSRGGANGNGLTGLGPLSRSVQVPPALLGGATSAAAGGAPPPAAASALLQRSWNEPPVLSAACAAMLMSLSEAIRHVLEGMRGYVSLHIVLTKVLADHSKETFGEFRDIILSMMDTFAYERRILSTATALMRRDVYEQVARLHRGFCGPVAAVSPLATCAACGNALVGAGGASSNSGAAAVKSGGEGESGAGGSAAAPGSTTAAGSTGRSASSAFVAFGCRHCFHHGCVPPRALTRGGCPQCDVGSGGGEGDGDGDADGEDSGLGGGKVSDAAAAAEARLLAASGHRLGLLDDLDDDGAGARDRGKSFFAQAAGSPAGKAGARERAATRGFGGGAGGGAGGDDDDATLQELDALAAADAEAAAAAAAAREGDEEEDPHRARLARLRGGRGGGGAGASGSRCGRALVDLYADLQAAPSAVQVRTVHLDTVPGGGSGGGSGESMNSSSSSGYYTKRRTAPPRRDPDAAMPKFTGSITA